MKRSSQKASRAALAALVILAFGSLLGGPQVGTTTGHLGEAPFVSVVEPVGVSATPGRLLVTHPLCGDPSEVLSIDSSGAVSVFATLSPRGNACFEQNVAVAGPADPSRPGFPSPTRGGFPSNFAYVTRGPKILQITLDGTVSLFTTIPSCVQSSETGITFDRVGSFRWNMIVVCSSGKVWQVTATGAVTLIADVAEALGLASVRIENPDVAPLSFTPYGGQLFVAAEDLGKVLAVSPSGVVSMVASWSSAEGVNFIPLNKCNFGTSDGSFFTAIFRSAKLGPGTIYRFPLTAFAGKSGSALVTSESGPGIGLLTSTSGTITTGTFHESIGRHEGSVFVDCTVPLLLKIIVKPGSVPHTIDPKTEPKVPVAILSSAIFNAVKDTVQSSIRVGVTGTENSVASCSATDVNKDGRLDLLCQAVTRKLGITTPGVYSGPLVLKLTYNAPGGDPVGEGSD